MRLRWFLGLLTMFTLFPLLELVLLIEVGKRVGTLNTILIILLTGVVGAALARSQGLSLLGRIHRRLQQGELPGNELIDGGLVLIAAAFLVTPGLITDLMGFSLIIPFTRQLVRELIKQRLMQWVGSGVTTYRLHRE